MNTSIIKNRSNTPIVSRDFDQSINVIKSLKGTLPEIKNSVIESTLPNLKDLTNFAKKSTFTKQVATELMERARTEKILGKYSKK